MRIEWCAVAPIIPLLPAAGCAGDARVGYPASAFIGRRHFGVADLLERYFERVP